MTHIMKRKTIPARATTALFATLGFVTSAFGEVYFKADFNDSTAVDDDSGLVANATLENLNAGTEVGSWAFTGGNLSDPRGAIVSNPDNNDNAFVFDDGISGGPNRRATGLFTQPVNIGSGDALRFEFDIFPTRQGNTDQGRQVRLALTDSGGTVGGSRAYLLIFNMSAGGASKEFRWLSSGNDQNSISIQEGVGFQNAAVDNYQDWDWAEGKPIRVRIDVLGLATITTPGRARVWIDWNGDGTWDTEDFPIGGRDVGVTSIDRFELFYSGFETTPKGIYIDNISAIAEVEEDPYQDWAATVGLTPPDDGRSDDKDGDGIANVLEWVFGTDPLTPGPSNEGFDAQRVGDDFVFTFNRDKDTLGNVPLAFEYSENLTDWTSVTVPAATEGIFTITDAGAFDVVSATVPAPAGGKLFTRLRAE